MNLRVDFCNVGSLKVNCLNDAMLNAEVELTLEAVGHFSARSYMDDV